MDLLKTAGEIGLFELAANVSACLRSSEAAALAEASMPLPGEDAPGRIKAAADWLLSFGKTRYMFLTPELSIMDELYTRSGGRACSILAMPCCMDAEAKARLRENLPPAGVTTLDEPFFDDGFYPGNGLLVVCGYSAGGVAMVLPQTYRMAEHYDVFRGRKVFLPFVELAARERRAGWMELSSERFSAEWRAA